MRSEGPSERLREIRVAVRDRRRLLGEGLALLIGGMEGFTARCMREHTVGTDGPDLIIVGAHGDLEPVVDQVLVLQAQEPRADIVLMADSMRPQFVRLVLEHRLSGLLLSDSSPRDLEVSLRQVFDGHAVLPSGWQRVISREREDPIQALSDRQLDVLSLLIEGLSYEEIARRLYISPNTVKFHVRSVFLRLGVRNRMAAARVAGESLAARRATDLTG